MKKRVRSILHKINNEFSKFLPQIEIMAETPDENHTADIQNLRGTSKNIYSELNNLKTAVVNKEFSQLYHLSYFSKWDSSENDIQSDVEKILLRARPFNNEHEISGMLIYRSGYFIQYIEGELEDLFTVYGRICLDKRHKDVKLLSYSPIDQRLFKGWDMGSYIATSKEDDLFEDFFNKMINSSLSRGPTEILTYMNFFSHMKKKGS